MSSEQLGACDNQEAIPECHLSSSSDDRESRKFAQVREEVRAYWASACGISSLRCGVRVLSLLSLSLCVVREKWDDEDVASGGMMRMSTV